MTIMTLNNRQDGDNKLKRLKIASSERRTTLDEAADLASGHIEPSPKMLDLRADSQRLRWQRRRALR
ncbi:hypothetical protein [Rhizobium leguminosarum]|uniref:Uncharacterized protein n=1 Tax=Rhizobium leguminosarum TaxID=384 RepID=A0A2K9ZHB6_RHILE|nr:hypothetical protein [Rhizobium leguminosarum]AUW47657.1 hypothetical protein CUJ84_pRLN3000549 [Rhizobium leguminosarum]